MTNTAKTIEMGTAQQVEIRGCVVVCDGQELDSYNSRAKTGRAGYRVWTLTDEQVATIKGKLFGIGDQASPMRGADLC
jgi:hypothetical protein